jgi:hypothetical protein
MYLHADRDMSDNIDEIERVVESLMSQSPVISAALDRVNSVSSEVSQMSLYPSDAKPIDVNFHKPRQLSRLVTSTSSGSLKSRPTEPYSPATSAGILSGSEIASSEPTDGASSVGQLSPTISRQSPMWKPPERRVTVGMSVPMLPTTPEIEPGRKRPASETDSLRLPLSAWDDAGSTKSGGKYSHVPSTNAKPVKVKRSASTTSQQQTFEKALFKNSAIYCDLSVPSF